MLSIPDVSEIDHLAEVAGRQWTDMVARIDKAAAADYVCDQLRADLLTDGHPLCYALSHLCEYPPDLWNWDEVAATFTSLSERVQEQCGRTYRCDGCYEYEKHLRG